MIHSPAPALKAVLILLVAGCIGLTLSAVSQAVAGRWLPLAVSAVIWLPLAWGLWQRRPLARRVAVALLWLIVIVLPIGLINPFAAMDDLVSGGLLNLAVPVYGLVAAALLCLHILGKYKKEFGHGG